MYRLTADIPSCNFGLALHLQCMHDCNPCLSRPASFPSAPQMRRSHVCCTTPRERPDTWQISTRLQRQRRQSAGQAVKRTFQS